MEETAQGALDQVFDKERYDRLVSQLEDRLKNMGERKALHWLKKHKSKWTKKTVAKCLK